jgi:hypothetical protein
VEEVIWCVAEDGTNVRFSGTGIGFYMNRTTLAIESE